MVEGSERLSMTLGELRRSLTRFSKDMDEIEILFTDHRDGKPHFDNMAFVAYSEVGEHTFLVLGTMAAALERMKNGTLKYESGKNPGKEGFDLSG